MSAEPISPNDDPQIPPKPPDIPEVSVTGMDKGKETEELLENTSKWGGNKSFKSILLTPYSANQEQDKQIDEKMKDSHTESEKEYNNGLLEMMTITGTVSN